MNFKFKRFFGLFYEKSVEEEITGRAAQVAFYFIFALFPLLLFIFSLFGLILKSGNELRRSLFGYLGDVMPASAFNLVNSGVTNAIDNSSGGTLTIGFIIALWSASAGMDSIIVALNRVYNIEETRSWWKHKLISLLLTLASSLLIFFALAIVIYGADLLNLLLTAIDLPAIPAFISGIVSFIAVALALLLILTLVYNFGPNHEDSGINWINAGSITALVLWIVLSIGFRIYLNFFDTYAQTYGSVGAVIILLLWLYLTALVILIGGMINAILDKHYDELTTEADTKESAEKETQQESF